MAKALLALTDKDKKEFFPGNMLEKLSVLLSVREIDPLKTSSQDLLSSLQDFQAEILISGWKMPAIPEIVLEMTDLNYICHVTGTVRSIIPRKLIEDGLLVSNWGGSISRTVSEAALMMILASLRRMSGWALDMHTAGAWKDDSLVNQSLFGRTVGLHGFGAISRELVPLLKPFGCPILTYSPSVPREDAEKFGVKKVDSLEELFSSSQVLVELAPYKPENHHIVTEEILRLLPEGACFVNVGRGAVVDEEALARIAAEGKLQIALDVYEVEPLPKDSPFRGMKNVTLLPHQGGPTIDRRRDAGAYALQNIKRYLAGMKPESIVDLRVYDLAT